MEKLSERLTNLNKISKYILKYGLLVVLIGLIISNILLKNADISVDIAENVSDVCNQEWIQVYYYGYD